MDQSVSSPGNCDSGLLELMVQSVDRKPKNGSSEDLGKQMSKGTRLVQRSPAKWWSNLLEDRGFQQIEEPGWREKEEGSHNFVFMHTRTVGYAHPAPNHMLWAINAGSLGEGFIGYFHGGFISTLMDQAMATLLFLAQEQEIERKQSGRNQNSEVKAVRNQDEVDLSQLAAHPSFATASMQIYYYRPVPIKSTILLESKITHVAKRKALMEVCLFDMDDNLMAKANAVFAGKDWHAKL